MASHPIQNPEFIIINYPYVARHGLASFDETHTFINNLDIKH